MSVIEEVWNYRLDLNEIEGINYDEFELSQKYLHDHILQLLEDAFKMQRYNYSGNLTQSHDDELKVLIERNKQLRHEIDLKLDEISQQQMQYETYKKDQKLLSQEIKETHEAFLMAKKYYKKFLKMYYTIEANDGDKQTIFVQFFTEAKKDSENYSIRFLRDTKTGSYQLLSTIPKLQIEKQLHKNLQETNDVPGALCCIRQAFIAAKQHKKQ